MKELLKINVQITGADEVKGNTRNVSMLYFTGEAGGELFNGSVIGRGVDTQKTTHGGEMYLSARYMLEGTDNAGEKCRIFIENNGSFSKGFTPFITTDSKALAFLESTELSAKVDGNEHGVMITIYK